jgi:glutaredoxin
MITLFSLKECSRCTKLIELLNSDNIEFKIIYDDEHESLFDSIEEIVESTEYPIVKIEYTNNPTRFLYIVNSYSSSKELYIIKYRDIDHAFKLIKQNT